MYNRNLYIVIVPILALIVNACECIHLVHCASHQLKCTSHRMVYHMVVFAGLSHRQHLRILDQLYHSLLFSHNCHKCCLYQYVLIADRAKMAALISLSIVAIAYRIYAPSRGLGPGMPSTLLPVTIAIIESGALYTVAMLSLLLAYVTHSNGKYTALDCVAPLIVCIHAFANFSKH